MRDRQDPLPMAPVVLSTSAWHTRAAAHLARVQPYTQARRDRRARGESHPVHDFLFQYYSYSAGKLEAWHPDAREAIADSAQARERFGAPLYRLTDGALHRDAAELTPGKRETLAGILALLRATRERSAQFGCFGLHE